jgi:agmatinase
MLKPKLKYLEALETAIPGAWAIIGAGLDLTGSYKLGAAEGPAGLREASDCLEDYCPISDRQLQELGFADLGDVDLAGAGLEEAAERIKEAVAQALGEQSRPLLLGGEHTVTVPALTAVAKKHPGVHLIQFDAHADLRKEYHGTPLSHACVVRRAAELLGNERVHQVGIRSGTREEWAWMREHGSLLQPEIAQVQALVRELGDKPVYLTLDLDVLDPSVLPGTGTPEPGGVTYRQLDDMIRCLSSLQIVGADVVELAPSLDPSGVSAITAAKLVRTILLNL